MVDLKKNLFLAFGDIHIHDYKNFSHSAERLSICLKCLETVFFLAESNNCKYILFTGDLFDSARQVPTVVLNRTIDTFANLFNRYSDITFISISGNHDYATKATLIDNPISSQYVFTRLFNHRFLLLDSGEKIIPLNEDTIVVGVPFYEHTADYIYKVKSAYKTIVEKGYEHYPNKILLTHVTLSDYADFFGRVSSKLTEFSLFNLVLCGDIHRYGVFNNVIMTGSPLHKDFSDASTDNKDKYVHIFDTTQLPKHLPIKVDHLFPRFYISYKGSDKDAQGIKPIDYVREVIPVGSCVNTDISTLVKLEENNIYDYSYMITQFWEKEDKTLNKDLLTKGLEILKLSEEHKL